MKWNQMSKEQKQFTLIHWAHLYYDKGIYSFENLRTVLDAIRRTTNIDVLAHNIGYKEI